MKFNLVGALGIAVQLGVLWMLIGLGLHYMLATMLAVESAVLHNFVWHERFTWADRTGKRRWEIAGRLFRFSLTTGAVSIGGNLVLMRLMVGEAHFRPVLANLVSVAGCSLLNFLVSDRWVFRAAAVAGSAGPG
jgi:dolichol-phosphate mannosyltransferase